MANLNLQIRMVTYVPPTLAFRKLYFIFSFRVYLCVSIFDDHTALLLIIGLYQGNRPTEMQHYVHFQSN
jgi:hypothetical protein